MNKKLNTVLFILAATLVNLILMLVLFFGLFILLVNFVSQESSLFPMLLAILFLVSIGSSFLVYTLLMKKLSMRVNLEDYLMPLFSKRKGGNGRNAE